MPSENKKDQRSIEQTLADIQAKKRQKLSHPQTTEVAAEQPVQDDQPNEAKADCAPVATDSAHVEFAPAST